MRRIGDGKRSDVGDDAAAVRAVHAIDAVDVVLNPDRWEWVLTSVTSAYAVLPMNATSIAPPSGMTCGGRQLANVVNAPVFGSTREISPLAGSGT